MRSTVPLAVSEGTARRLPADVRGAVAIVAGLPGFANPDRPPRPFPDATEEEIWRIVRRIRLRRATPVQRAIAVRTLLRLRWRGHALARLVSLAARRPAQTLFLRPPELGPTSITRAPPFGGVFERGEEVNAPD